MQHQTVCRMCAACCPVTVEVRDGRLLRAERKSSLPREERLVCPKLAAAPDIVYSPERIPTPLVRDPGEPPGVFRKASWDEALDRVAERFGRLKTVYGAETVAWLRGMAADWGCQWDYANRLMNAFGSPNTIGNGSVCHVARDMAHEFTYGAMTVPQLKSARCIVVWGKNDRNTGPGAWEAILHARRHGAKLIVVDPVKTPLADMADIWLQVKPAHDGWLAMAMIHEIIENDLYDRDFVRKYCTGFDALARAARAFPAESVASRLWLDPAEIRKAARLYATTRPACIEDGNGLDMQLHVFQATRAVCTLRAITGNLDREGGDAIPQPVPLQHMQLRERRPAGVRSITQEAYPLFSGFHETLGLHAQSCVVDAILEERPYPIRMLVVQSSNPAVTMTDAQRVRKALEKLEFLVVIDPFLTQTARLAHVVLPATTCFEKTQLNLKYMCNSPVFLQDRVIDAVGDSRPDWRIVFGLARRMGLEAEFPWRTAEEAIDHQLAPSGLTVDRLRQHPEGVRVDALRFEKYRTDGFHTPSGKVELFSERLAEAGHPPVPCMDGFVDNPLPFADTIGEGALIGMSGERPGRFTHTQFHHVPSLLESEGEAFVDIHPEDAGPRRIHEGERVTVATPRGRVRMKARISTEVHAGSIRMAWGWGEVDPEWNLNRLTDDARRDPITCTPSNRSFMCRIEAD